MTTTTPQPQAASGRERFTVNLDSGVMRALRHEKAETKKPYGRIIEECLKRFLVDREPVRDQ